MTADVCLFDYYILVIDYCQNIAGGETRTPTGQAHTILSRACIPISPLRPEINFVRFLNILFRTQILNIFLSPLPLGGHQQFHVE